jgi:hypothetical protein
MAGLDSAANQISSGATVGLGCPQWGACSEQDLCVCVWMATCFWWQSRKPDTLGTKPPTHAADIAIAKALGIHLHLCHTCLDLNLQLHPHHNPQTRPVLTCAPVPTPTPVQIWASLLLSCTGSPLILCFALYGFGHPWPTGFLNSGIWHLICKFQIIAIIV